MLVPIGALIIIVGAFAIAAIDEFVDSPPLAVVLQILLAAAVGIRLLTSSAAPASRHI
jgi:hypothetical protein